MSLFSGLSSFPISPLHGGHLDRPAFEQLLINLVQAGVNSIGVLGSTGCYAYMSPNERKDILHQAVSIVGEVPIFVSIGATGLRDILKVAEDAQKGGAQALLLPAVSYFPLSQDEVFHLYERVNQSVSVPLIVYDTPGTTQFHFSDALLVRICELDHVKAVKFPSGVPNNKEASDRFNRLKGILPKKISLGVSGDPHASHLLHDGAKCWYSEWGGIFPKLARQLTDATFAGRGDEVEKISSIFRPFWKMSEKYGGSLRVIASVAYIKGLVKEDVLPAPLLCVNSSDRDTLKSLINTYNPS